MYKPRLPRPTFNEMNIVSLFTRRERIVGIDINDAEIRLAILGEDKNGAPRIALLASEKVPPGIIAGGVVKDPKALTLTLAKLVRSAHEGRKKTNITYAIVSISADAAYTRLYDFPSSIKGARLEETMKLTVGFQLPVKTEDVYLDWEKTTNETKNEVSLSSMKKSAVDAYLTALHDAGIRTVALEIHPQSTARSAEFSNKTTLLVEESTDSTVFSIISAGIVQFVRAVPKTNLPNDKVREEIRKISDFAEAKGIKPEITTTIGKLMPREPFSLYPNLKDEGGMWLIAIGAAVRGLIPRDKDTLVSLLPVGTETAYAYQKAQIFSAFIANIIVGLSIFFIATFAGTWLLLVSIEQRIAAQVERAASLPLPENASGLEERAVKLNALVAQTLPLVQSFQTWSPVLNEIKARVTAGIFITGISIPGPSNQIGITGVAKTRQSLNEFKRSLDDSAIFGTITLPLTNLEQRENIPFSASFVLEKQIYVQ